MEKKKYYVSIHTSASTYEIREEKGQSTYDFEIEASPEEIEQLKYSFEKAASADFKSYLHSHVPFPNDMADADHETYDNTLNTIYDKIYTLGTTETKSQIEEMGVLNAMKGIPGDQSIIVP